MPCKGGSTRFVNAGKVAGKITSPFYFAGHDAIYQDHSRTKYQVVATFARLLARVNEAVQVFCGEFSFPSLYLLPQSVKASKGLTGIALLTLDGAPAHHKEDLMTPFGQHLFRSQLHPDIFIFFTLPGRSHTLQVGDKLVNKTLRDHTRRAAKLRLLEHCLNGAQGITSILECGEPTMKTLLVSWISGWLRDPRLEGWVMSSWASALKEEPEVQSVDEVPGPPAIIYLGPPLVEV